MSSDSNKSWLEYLRIATPIMIFALGVYVNLMNNSMTELKSEIVGMRADMFHHLTNAELHIPRATIVSKDEFFIYQSMRDKQMEGVKEGMTRIETLLQKHTENNK